jgi:hypothetical protein
MKLNEREDNAMQYNTIQYNDYTKIDIRNEFGYIHEMINVKVE